MPNGIGQVEGDWVKMVCAIAQKVEWMTRMNIVYIIA